MVEFDSVNRPFALSFYIFSWISFIPFKAFFNSSPLEEAGAAAVEANLRIRQSLKSSGKSKETMPINTTRHENKGFHCL